MPSFRVTPSELLEEKRKAFQAEMEKAGILDLYRKALTILREKFMEDDLPEDPLGFIKEQLGIPETDSKEIEHLKKELVMYREELMKYDETLKRLCTQADQDESMFDGNLMYGLFYTSSCRDNNLSIVPKLEHSLQKSGSSTSEAEGIEDFEQDKDVPKLKFECEYFSTTLHLDDESNIMEKEEYSLVKVDSFQLDVRAATNFERDSPKLASAKAKLRVPGGPMVESKREECRKMMEKLGILIVLERGLAAIMMEQVFPKDPLLFLRENLRTHSPEFHEIRALIKEISIVQKRLAEFKIKEEKENKLAVCIVEDK